MRFKLAAAALAAGMLVTATACGGDDGRSTDEICDDLNATLDPREAELTSALQEAGLAAGQGDQAALATAMVTLDEIVNEVNEAVRKAAEETSDEQFRTALESFADELDNLVTEIASGSLPDPQAIQDAGDGVGQFCDE